jgi:hypothetical protein
VKYAAIADWATDKQFTVTFMCAQLGVARQGYYRWLADGPCKRERTVWVPESMHTARDLPVRPRQLAGMIR